MLGVIGGSGLYDLDQFDQREQLAVSTDYGQPSSALILGRIKGVEQQISSEKQQKPGGDSDYDIAFLARHGEQHAIPPHCVNYRANIQAMVDIGVDRILSVNAVGACDAGLAVGSLLCPDQIIDYSYGREHTFFDSFDSIDCHIDFTYPFSQRLREQLQASARALAVSVVDGGTYACTQGPRLETAAEVKRISRDGGDVIGMTAMPEASLARERQLDYASLCIVVNPAAGVSDTLISTEEISQTLASSMDAVKRLIIQMLAH